MGSNTRFELAVRAASQFFAAFVGFALTHLLGAAPDTEIGQHKLLFLSIAICLVLRFFFGSANHLWFEYGIDGTAKNVRTARWENWLFIKDLLFLTCFGIFAAMVASSTEMKEFFKWSFSFVTFALLWNGANMVAQVLLPENERSFGDWRLWFVADLIQVVAFGGIWVAVSPAELRIPIFNWDMSWILRPTFSWVAGLPLGVRLNGVLFLSFLALLVDLYTVLWALEKSVGNRR